MPFSLALIGLFACGGTPQIDDDIVRLDWTDGQEFHVAAKTRIIVAKGGENPVDMISLDPLGGNLFEERWTEETIWTYKVVDADLVPDADDTLYEFAVNGAGKTVPLSVIKVTIDPTLNEDPQLLELDPVIYLVFRQQRNRLAGIIEFTNVDGERSEKAFSTKELSRSTTPLSQSRLSMAPTYLSPFGARWSGGERKLENGKTIAVNEINDGMVDIQFEDMMGGDRIKTRYTAGKPWPVMTESDNLVAELLTADEVAEIRGDAIMAQPDFPETFDFRAALRSSIDLDSSMKLDADTLENKGYTAEVAEEYRPWAGAWWPLKKGELVFGYEYNRRTFSDEIKDQIDPLKIEMDKLSAEIREMDDRSSAEATEKRAARRELQEEVQEFLNTFYDGVLADLDGGKIRIENGYMKRDADEEFAAWNYKLDLLSPMDKYGLVIYLQGESRENPFLLSSWELMNSYYPGGDTWWGHCNGWAAAAILTNEPTEPVMVNAGDHEIEFTTADIKGLLTESHYSTESSFYGERYNGEEQDIADLSPAHFHKLVSFYLKEQGVPFVFDTTASEAVWNFPAWKVEIDMEEIKVVEVEGKVNINTADLETLQTLTDIDEDTARKIIEFRENDGAFQDKWSLTRVINWWGYYKIRNEITTEIAERHYEVIAKTILTTDSVDADHIDSGAEPESFDETWGYTLITNSQHEIIGGEWDKEDEHPDFAWVPYHNPRTKSWRGSENPHLGYGDLLDMLGDDIERR